MQPQCHLDQLVFSRSSATNAQLPSLRISGRGYAKHEERALRVEVRLDEVLVFRLACTPEPAPPGSVGGSAARSGSQFGVEDISPPGQDLRLHLSGCLRISRA